MLVLDAANTDALSVAVAETLPDPDTLLLSLTVDRLDGSACGRICILLLAEGLRLLRTETLALLVLEDERILTVVALRLLVIRLLGEEDTVDVCVRLLNLLAD
jgi:hypothetical protein